MIAIAIIITTILKNIIAYVQEIPERMRKAAQVVKATTKKSVVTNPSKVSRNPTEQQC